MPGAFKEIISHGYHQPVSAAIQMFIVIRKSCLGSAAGPVVIKVDTSLLGRRVIIDIAYANLSH